MTAATLMTMPRDEAERLKSLSQYEILDTLPDPALDEITRLAAEICNAPFAYIGFIDGSRLWFKSRLGFLSRQQPRASSACQYTMQQPQATVIDDAALDYRFAPSGVALAAGTHCRSYAGAPLLAPNGAVLGTLAVCSPEPGIFTQEHGRTLEVLGRQIVTRLELYHRTSRAERAVRSRHRIERALTVERNFATAVLEGVGALVLVLDSGDRVVRFNQACERVSGYSFAELVGRSLPQELFPPEERALAVQLFAQARAGSLNDSYEMAWRTRENGLRSICWTAAPLPDSEGDSGYVITTGVDLTDQRRAEEKLRASEMRYRQTVEGSLGIICSHDMEGVMQSINAHAAATLGYTPEEIIGTPLSRYLAPEFQESYAAYVSTLREQGEHNGQFTLVRRDGQPLVVDYRNKLVLSPAGAPMVLSHGIDITGRKQAEEELHALTRQQESILEAVGDGIWGLDLQGRLTFCNRAGASMCGYSSSELVGQDIHALVHHTYPDGRSYPETECPILHCLKSGTPLRVNNEVFWRKDRSCFPVEYVARQLVYEGKVRGIVVAFADVTERRRLERMKDEFISTVSHELRTPLTSVRAALGLISAGMLQERPVKQQEMLVLAVNNCDRLIRLVNDIVDFDRIGSEHLPLHREHTSAEMLLEQAAEAYQTEARSKALSLVAAAEPVTVWVDRERILQTLGNLLGNAIKFSPPGAEVRLRARATGEDEVTFEVADAGRGIPQEKQEMIFERFQQGDASDTRTMGGTGIGLALCRAIVEQHGGCIAVKSAPGEGSTFSFTVPRLRR